MSVGKAAGKFRVSVLTVTFIELVLNEKWSAEEIARVGKINGLNVSHEWICGYVQCDKFRGCK